MEIKGDDMQTTDIITDGIRAGLIKVDLVPGEPRDFDVAITNGSGVAHTTITASSYESAWGWTQHWADHITGTDDTGRWMARSVEVTS